MRSSGRDQRNRHAMRRQRGAVIDVVHPLQRRHSASELTSRIMREARSSQVLLLPTEEEGISEPSARMPLTSITAMSSGPRNPCHAIGATWLRCMSKYSISPRLIFSRDDRIGIVGQAEFDAVRPWPARRRVRDRSKRPVQTRTRNGSPGRVAASIRAASASGTAFG